MTILSTQTDCIEQCVQYFVSFHHIGLSVNSMAKASQGREKVFYCKYHAYFKKVVGIRFIPHGSLYIYIFNLLFTLRFIK